MLTEAEIKRFISDDISSEKKRMAAVGQNYYEAKHDILNYRLFYWNDENDLVEDTMRSNIKISHPFFTEISDQFTAYMLSFEDKPIMAIESADGLQEHLDRYFDEAFWSEISDLISGAYNKGFEYLYGYQSKDGEKDRLKFKCADSMGVVEVREKDTDDGCKYIIYWYIDRIEKGRKQIRRVQVWSESGVSFYVQAGTSGKVTKDTSEKLNPRPHVVYTDPDTGKKMAYQFGYIPFWRLDNNKKQFSGLKPIKALIDDYDLHACSLSNNLKDFDTPLHVIRGFEGNDLSKLQLNLKTKKVVGVDADGGVEVKTVDIPYEARKVKMELDEKNIYRFGMGLNTSDLKDTSATTNMLIKAAYSLMDLKAQMFDKRLRPFLMEIIKVVLNEINEQNGTDYQPSDVEIKFNRSIMTNDTENIQNEKIKAETKQIEITTINNVAALIGDEKALQLICEQLDIDFDEVKKVLDDLKEEKNLKDAQTVLEGVVTDEQQAEAGSGTIPE